MFCVKTSYFGGCCAKPRYGTTARIRGNYWNEYYPDAISTLLQLRLEGTNSIAHNVVMNPQGVTLGNIVSTIPRGFYTIIPVLYKEVNRPAHWVGVIVDSISVELQVTYIDPENNPIPALLQDAIGTSIHVNQYFVEHQKYHNNCGPELIENCVFFITGARISQDLVPEYHSQLLERNKNMLFTLM